MSKKTLNATIGDICDLVNGRAFKPEDWSESGLPIVRIQNLNDETKPFNYYEGDYSPKHEVNTGDLLFSWSGTPGTSFGAFFWHRGKGVLNQHIFNVHFDRARVDGGYFRYAINNRLIQIIGQAHGGVGLKHVTKGRFEAVEIPLPPLSEQKRIAEILDRAEALRAKRRAALALLDELTQSIFLDMFGDPAVNPHDFPTVQLSSLIRDDDRLNYGVVQPGDDVAIGIPLVRVSDLRDGKIDVSNLKRITKEIESSYKRSRLKGDEILISCVGSVGSVALVDESQKGFNIARAVARVPLVETCNRVFIAEFLRSHHVQRYFTGELRTVSQPTLNIKQIGETEIQLPPLEMQIEFANRVEELAGLQHQQVQAALILDECFSSLQHRAFRGEL